MLKDDDSFITDLTAQTSYGGYLCLAELLAASTCASAPTSSTPMRISSVLRA